MACINPLRVLWRNVLTGLYFERVGDFANMPWLVVWLTSWALPSPSTAATKARGSDSNSEHCIDRINQMRVLWLPSSSTAHKTTANCRQSIAVIHIRWKACYRCSLQPCKIEMELSVCMRLAEHHKNILAQLLAKSSDGLHFKRLRLTRMACAAGTATM